jgi:hypothetical protein
MAIAYENWLNRKHKDKSEGKISNDLTAEEMQSMLNTVRNK